MIHLLLLAALAGLGDTPVKTNPGVVLDVNCTNCSGSGGTSGGSFTGSVFGQDGGYLLGVWGNVGAQGFDGGYPLSVDQHGTWDVGVIGTVGVTGTFWQATQPVSAVSLPLPSGASTSAKQPAIGTAGTPSVDVLSMQGLDGGYPEPVNVLGTVGVTGVFWQTTQPVSGTFWQSTQPVSLTTLPALVAGSAVIGHVITDSSSTTACTQATGTNLHAVLDTTSTTACTQATGTNLHVVVDTAPTTAVTIATAPALVASSAVIGHVIVDTAPTTAVSQSGSWTNTVTQATGTNLHAVLDTTSTTAVTQATGTNLHTVVDSAPTTTVIGSQAEGAAATQHPLMIAALDANGLVAYINADAFGNLMVGGTAGQNAATEGGPVIAGGIARSGTPTTASNGNTQNFITNLDGSQFVTGGGPNRFSCGVSGLGATLTQCEAVPGAGLFLYIDAIYVQTTTATSGTYNVSCGTGTNCGTTNVALFPVSGTSNRFNAPITSQAMAQLTFPTPLKCPTANQEICIIGVATNTISAQIEGHIGH